MKKYIILAAVLIILIGVLAAAYQFHPPTKQWLDTNVVSKFKPAEPGPESLEEFEQQLTVEMENLKARYEKEEKEKAEAIAELKAEKAALEAELKRLKSE